MRNLRRNLLAAGAAIAIAIACGRGEMRSLDVGPDAGMDAGSDAGYDGGYDTPDAGTDAGTVTPDAGADAGADAGPVGPPPRWGQIDNVTTSDGWHIFTSADGLPANVMGASADEAGNLWVAGGSSGVFVSTGGRFRQFTLADGLHPYGYMPDGSPADRNPSLDATPAISISGGPGSSAFVGYAGKPGCEDEWDRLQDNHAATDPSIYKSGDADKVVLNGGGISVAHYDIFSGPNVVPNEKAGREKLCSVYRILWQRGTDYVWFGANHGFALGVAGFTGNPTCNGIPGRCGVYEHVHPAVNEVHGWFITDLYYGIAVDTIPHFDKAGTAFFDVWFGGFARTTRFRFGEELGNYWAAQPRTELYTSHGGGDIANDPAAQAAYWNRMDIWPDPIGERRDPAHGDWRETDPDFKNPADWVFDNVTGIAAMKGGDAWIGSWTNGMRHVDHDGKFLGDAPPSLPSKSIGAIVRDPSDESIWIGYRDPGMGVSRLMADGSLRQYGPGALGGHAGSRVWDIQVQPGTPRRIIVTFREGAVGVYSGQ